MPQVAKASTPGPTQALEPRHSREQNTRARCAMLSDPGTRYRHQGRSNVARRAAELAPRAAPTAVAQSGHFCRRGTSALRPARTHRGSPMQPTLGPRTLCDGRRSAAARAQDAEGESSGADRFGGRLLPQNTLRCARGGALGYPQGARRTLVLASMAIIAAREAPLRAHEWEACDPGPLRAPPTGDWYIETPVLPDSNPTPWSALDVGPPPGHTLCSAGAVLAS